MGWYSSVVALLIALLLAWVLAFLWAGLRSCVLYCCVKWLGCRVAGAGGRTGG